MRNNPTPGADNVTLLEFKDHSEGETEDQATNNSHSIRTPGKEPSGAGPRIVSYFDLSEPNSIDCTNHPMYQRACKKIEQLKKDPSSKFDKIASSLGGKNQAIPHDTDGEHLENRDHFFISKDCDFVTEHFKPQIELADAIEYLKQLVGRCREIDFGLRVVE
ncbi:MAG: hypothetical protein ACM3JQ_02465 [Candidatus Eiseniibacteriota bacterium]